MQRKVFAVIDNRAINNVTGYRKLVEEELFDKVNFEMIIEVTISGTDYVPVDEEVRRMFPAINRERVSRIILQH